MHDSHNAQRYKQTDGRTYGRHDDANSRSYCVALRSANDKGNNYDDSADVDKCSGAFCIVIDKRLTLAVEIIVPRITLLQSEMAGSDKHITAVHAWHQRDVDQIASNLSQPGTIIHISRS